MYKKESLDIIPEVKNFEQQLLQYQKRITNILESFTDAFFEVDLDWTVTYWNKEAEYLLDMPRNKIIGKNLWEVYSEAIPLKFYKEYHRAVSQHISVRFVEFFEPKKLWVEVAAFPSGDGLSVYFKDITASKLATNILEQERQKYRDLFNLSPLPQWVYDQETLRFLDVNEAAIHHYGYSKQEFLQMTIRDIRPQGQDLKVLDDILCNHAELGSFKRSSVRHRKKNGKIISVCVEGNSVLFEGSKARLVMVIDRTKEIQASQALAESLKRYETVSKATSDAVWDWDITTGEMFWNQGIKGIFGHRKTVYTHKWWQEHVHPDDLEEVLRQFNSLVKNNKARLKVEYRFRCADGSYRFVLDRAFITFDSAGAATRMIGSIQDITEKVNHIQAIETQNLRLQEISWMQSHKVRSPLARILSFASLLESCTDLSDMKELLPLLKLSAEELDQVLKEIVRKTEAAVQKLDP